MKTWSSEKANAWYEQLKWQVGLNFVPSNAINPTEMWQSEKQPRLLNAGLFPEKQTVTAAFSSGRALKAALRTAFIPPKNGPPDGEPFFCARIFTPFS